MKLFYGWPICHLYFRVALSRMAATSWIVTLEHLWLVPVETVTQPSKVMQLVSAESESEPGPPTVDSGQTKSRRQYL